MNRTALSHVFFAVLAAGMVAGLVCCTQSHAELVQCASVTPLGGVCEECHESSVVAGQWEECDMEEASGCETENSTSDNVNCFVNPPQPCDGAFLFNSLDDCQNFRMAQIGDCTATYSSAFWLPHEGDPCD